MTIERSLAEDIRSLNPSLNDADAIRTLNPNLNESEIIQLQAEYDAQEYARNRQAEYPSVGDQLDMLMKDMKNNTTTHQESCEAVKLKYPKPS